MRRFWCVLVLLPALMTLAHAGTVSVFDSADSAYSGLAFPINNGSSITGQYASFNVTDLFQLNQLELYLVPGQTAGTGYLSIDLYSDNGSGRPGTLLNSLSSISDSTLLDGGANDYFFSFNGYNGSSTMVSTFGPGEYWIGLTAIDGSANTKWGSTTDTSGVGVSSGSFFYFFNSTPQFFANSAGRALQMDVSGTYVPEPSTMLLAALGLGAVALFRRRAARS